MDIDGSTSDFEYISSESVSPRAPSLSHHPSTMAPDELFTDQENPELDNPHRLGNESAAENHAAVHASTYAHLHNEMRGRVRLNQASVWTRLKVDAVDADIVTTCSNNLRINCADAIGGLQELESRTISADKRAELLMYPFLVRSLCSPLVYIHHLPSLCLAENISFH